MNNFKLPEHKKEYISNFSSESSYVISGLRDITFEATLLNLNYENGSIYYFSIFIYEVEKYDLFILGKLEEWEAKKGGISEKVPLVHFLSKSTKYVLPSYIDLPIKLTVKNLNYINDELYVAVFKIKDSNGVEIATSKTFIKGVDNGI